MIIAHKSQALALMLLLSPLTAEAKKHHKAKSKSKAEVVFAKDYKPESSDSYPESRVIGGTDSPLDEYPWYSRGVTSFGSWWGCGGTLVTPEFVLTAAHCGYDLSSGFQIGALCDPFTDGNNCGQKMETIYSTAVYDHPGWDPSAIVNDFTLVQLESRSTIDPVPIDQGSVSTSYTGGEPLWVLGLGADVHNPSGEKLFPDHVKHAEVPYVDTDTCSAIMDSYIPGLGITDVEMCAGPTSLSEPDKGTCNGDSGGPIYDKDRDTLVGVTSWGIQGGFLTCGATPGVYARIADQWEDWIKPTICDNHTSPKPDFCSSGPTPPTPPTPSPSPTSPTSCSSSEDLFTFAMRTDSKGEDISWVLKKRNDDGKFEDYFGGGAAAGFEYGDNTEYSEEYCVERDACFRFLIRDESGDGLCCKNGKGGYQISLNDSLIRQNRFKNKTRQRTNFGNC